MNDLQAIEAIESGSASHETVVQATQALIDSGTIWSLQGSYQRLAYSMVAAGECSMSNKGRAAA